MEANGDGGRPTIKPTLALFITVNGYMEKEARRMPNGAMKREEKQDEWCVKRAIVCDGRVQTPQGKVGCPQEATYFRFRPDAKRIRCITLHP